jgi:cation transport regulator ChaB
MIYHTIDDLPSEIREKLGLAKDILNIYKDAFNVAWEKHDHISSATKRLNMAHQVAWDAAKAEQQIYE